jgi:hypothetical protein
VIPTCEPVKADLDNWEVKHGNWKMEINQGPSDTQGNRGGETAVRALYAIKIVGGVAQCALGLTRF